MMNYTKNAALLLLLTMTPFLNAQTKNIVVVSAEDNAPIEGVLVSISSSNNSSITNKDGRVEFTDLQASDTLIFDNFDMVKTKILAGNLKSDTVMIEKEYIRLDPIAVSAFNKEEFFSKLLEGIPENYSMQNNLFGVMREKLTINDTIFRLLETSTLMNVNHYWTNKEPISNNIKVENYNQKYFKNISVKEIFDYSVFLCSGSYYEKMILGKMLKNLVSINQSLTFTSKEISENGDIRMTFVSGTFPYEYIKNIDYYMKIALVVDSTKSKVLNLTIDKFFNNTKNGKRSRKLKFDHGLIQESFTLNFKYDTNNLLILNNFNYFLNSTNIDNYKLWDFKNNFYCTIFEQVPNDTHSIDSQFNFSNTVENQILDYPDKINSSDIYYPLSEEEQEFIDAP